MQLSTATLITILSSALISSAAPLPSPASFKGLHFLSASDATPLEAARYAPRSSSIWDIVPSKDTKREAVPVVSTPTKEEKKRSDWMQGLFAKDATAKRIRTMFVERCGGEGSGCSS